MLFINVGRKELRDTWNILKIPKYTVGWHWRDLKDDITIYSISPCWLLWSKHSRTELWFEALFFCLIETLDILQLKNKLGCTLWLTSFLMDTLSLISSHKHIWYFCTANSYQSKYGPKSENKQVNFGWENLPLLKIFLKENKWPRQKKHLSYDFFLMPCWKAFLENVQNN